MSALSYEQQVAAVAAEITTAAEQLKSLQSGRDVWTKPEALRMNMGHDYVYLVGRSGKTYPGLEGLQAEALAYIDKRIAAKKAQIEGLRFKLVKLGREGGAAC